MVIVYIIAYFVTLIAHCSQEFAFLNRYQVSTYKLLEIDISSKQVVNIRTCRKSLSIKELSLSIRELPLKHSLSWTHIHVASVLGWFHQARYTCIQKTHTDINFSCTCTKFI